MATTASAAQITHRPLRRLAEPRPGSLRTSALATLAVIAGALIISVLMAVSILLAGPLPSSGGAPSAQPLPQPSAIHGLDR